MRYDNDYREKRRRTEASGRWKYEENDSYGNRVKRIEKIVGSCLS